MGTTLIAVGAALMAVLGLWALAALMRSRADRRFDVALARIDEHMAAIVEHVRRAGERMPTPHEARPVAIEPTLDLETLLEQVAREAGLRTGATAAVAHAEGPDGISARGSFGDPPEHDFLHGPLSASPETYRAVTVDWSHASGASQETLVYASALVVPLGGEGGTSGAIAVYGLDSDAFQQEDVRALEGLAAEVAAVVASACRVASIERRETTDAATGLRNERAYEQELDREVARSRRTGRPFALLVLEVAEQLEPSVAEEDCLWELAGLVLETTRSTDVVCRSGEREFVLLLPETDTDGAEVLLSRLEADIASRSFRLCSPTVRSARFVEWRAGDTARAVDDRARSDRDGRQRDETPSEQTRPSAPTRRALDARDEFVARLAGEIERARLASAPLSVLLLEPDVRPNGDGVASPTSSRSVLSELSAKLDDSLAGLATCSRTGRNQLGVALLGATDVDAERRFVELRDWLFASLPAVALAGGITRLAPTDRADTLFGRAQHALWKARQTGGSAVVVVDAPSSSTP